MRAASVRPSVRPSVVRKWVRPPSRIDRTAIGGASNGSSLARVQLFPGHSVLRSLHRWLFTPTVSRWEIRRWRIAYEGERATAK